MCLIMLEMKDSEKTIQSKTQSHKDLNKHNSH